MCVHMAKLQCGFNDNEATVNENTLMIHIVYWNSCADDARSGNCFLIAGGLHLATAVQKDRK